MLAYLFIFYFICPGLQIIQHYGILLSKHGNGPDPLSAAKQQPSMNHTHNGADTYKRGIHKPLNIAKEDAKKLMKKLKEIKYSKGSIAAKEGVLRKVIPEWFHKNGDADGDGDAEIEIEEHPVIKEEEGVGDDLDGVPGLQEPDTEEDTHAGADVDTNSKEVKNLRKESKTIRTLDNISQHYKTSSCPKGGVEGLTTTLVLQTTFDRLPFIRATCRRWNSPIVLVVYLSPDESENMWDKTIREYSALCDHLNMIPYFAESENERKFAYPINKLRNIGLDHVTTSHVLVLDIDLIPSNHLEKALVKGIELAIEARLDDDGDSGIDPKDAIVVPAFERKSPIKCKNLKDCQRLSTQDDHFIPASMSELKQCL